MKLSKRLSRALRISFVFMGLALVLITPGVLHCSGSLDVPDSSSSTLKVI